ncbi:MAG: hypothetical protein ACJ74T_07340 [Pyrinomonadaceae bacterium]
MSPSKMLWVFGALLLLLTAPRAFSQTGSQAASDSQTSKQVTAARRPSFVGTWIPKGEKDKMPQAGPDGWTKVNIEQQDSALKFSVVHAVGSKSKNYELTYYTDGRGETNSGMVYYFIVANSKLAGAEVKSKSAWDGDALVVVHRVSMPDQPIKGGVVYTSLDVTMRWEVSPDGKVLTRAIKQSNFSAFFRQYLAGEFKDTELPINQPQNLDSQDTYVLLEAKP